MNQEFTDLEFIAGFIVEAREHLDTIKPNLIELEKNFSDLSLVDEVYRPMHSLKGVSGFLGLKKINVLSHKTADLLKELNKGDKTATQETIDTIRSVTDALLNIIENLKNDNAEGDVEIDSILASLEAIQVDPG